MKEKQKGEAASSNFDPLFFSIYNMRDIRAVEKKEEINECMYVCIKCQKTEHRSKE